MKLSTRLLAGFVLIGATTALLGALSLDRLSAVHAAARSAVETRLPSGRLVSALDADLARIRLAEVHGVQPATDKERVSRLRASERSLAALVVDQSQYEPLISTQTEADLYDAFKSDLQRYLDARERVLRTAGGSRANDTRVGLGQASQAAFEQASVRLQELTELGVQASVDAAERVDAQYARSRLVITAFSALTLMAGLAFALVLVVSVTRPLNALVRGAERIGVGDISQRVTIHTHEEFRKLAESLNRLARSLGTAHESMEQQALVHTAVKPASE